MHKDNYCSKASKTGAIETALGSSVETATEIINEQTTAQVNNNKLKNNMENLNSENMQSVYIVKGDEEELWQDISNEKEICKKYVETEANAKDSYCRIYGGREFPSKEEDEEEYLVESRFIGAIGIIRILNDKDFSQGKADLERALNNGDNLAKYNKACFLYVAEKYEEAVSLLNDILSHEITEFEMRDLPPYYLPFAKRLLAQCYYYGRGVKKSVEIANILLKLKC